MAVGLQTAGVPTPRLLSGRPDVLTLGSLGRDPLVPAALALTLGMIADRYWHIPPPVSLASLLIALVAWLCASAGRRPGLPLVYLALAAVALGAADHHWHRDVYPVDDIGNLAGEEARPVRLRGRVDEEPAPARRTSAPDLLSVPTPDSMAAVLEVTSLADGEGWLPASGRVRVLLPVETPKPQVEDAPKLSVGQEIEIVGRLRKPSTPANPGELDYASYLRDQRIRAVVVVGKTSDAVVRMPERRGWSLSGWLGWVRGWAQGVLQESLSGDASGVAAAVLLGVEMTMTEAEWEMYRRTGVLHVLVISGQHLVILGLFLWSVLRLLGTSRRRGAFLVAVFLLGYALLTGARPPVIRAATIYLAGCGALLFRRPVMPANVFALSWLVIAFRRPTELFSTGCQLSFLAVAVLYWGAADWRRSDIDPLERLIDEGRPTWLRLLRWFGERVLLSYAATLAVWLAIAPLIAARYHLVAPVALVIGPPTVLLTSVALLAGFLLLLAAAVCWPLVPLFAWVTSWSLTLCERLVRASDRLPGSHWYVADIPDWWLWIFYVGLLSFLMLERLRPYSRYAMIAAVSWLGIGLVATTSHREPGELRCTFLAVGHGGCTVLETPDGRTLLYDAGALSGPEVARRQIAPYLWSRGIVRIDEILL
jgi:competence protein ComEC